MSFLTLGLLSLTRASSDLFYYNLTSESSGNFSNWFLGFDYDADSREISFTPDLDSDYDDSYPVIYNQTSSHIQGYGESEADVWFLTTSNGQFNYTHDADSASDVEIKDGYLYLDGSDKFMICSSSIERHGYTYLKNTPSVTATSDNCTDVKFKAANLGEARVTTEDYAIFKGNIQIMSNTSEFNNSTFGADQDRPIASNNSEYLDIPYPLVYNFETKEVRSSIQYNYTFPFVFKFDDEGYVEPSTCSEYPVLVDDEGYITYNGSRDFAVNTSDYSGSYFWVTYPYVDTEDIVKLQGKFVLGNRTSPYDQSLIECGENDYQNVKGDCPAQTDDKFMAAPSGNPQISWTTSSADADADAKTTSTSTTAKSSSTKSSSTGSSTKKSENTANVISAAPLALVAVLFNFL